jgi:hypothetical protein
MRAFKVIYGAKEKVFSCIEKARAFRDKKKAKYNNIVIRISDDDINPMIK